MIRYEDAELEEFVISGEADIAVPLEIYRRSDGECVFTVYRAVESAIGKALDRYSADPFSAESIKEFSKLLTPIVNDWGFKLDGKALGVTLEYSRCCSDAALLSDILSGCRVIASSDELDGVPSRLLHRPTPDAEDENDVAAVMIADGQIVAEASVNDYSDEENALEINVECAAGYRGRGYGASCVAALTAALTARGIKVNYKCRRENLPSRRIAEKLNFNMEGERISFVCYRFAERQTD